MKTAKCGASNPASGSTKKKAKKYAEGGMPKKKAMMGYGGMSMKPKKKK